MNDIETKLSLDIKVIANDDTGFWEIHDEAGFICELESESTARLLAKAPDLLFAAKCALADLEGIMPEFEPSGDREHPAWETIKLLKKAIK
jgi:hypothetical protein